ncbi:hypothetical protein, partial [Pseudoalteromonas sp. SR45-5]
MNILDDSIEINGVRYEDSSLIFNVYSSIKTHLEFIYVNDKRYSIIENCFSIILDESEKFIITNVYFIIDGIKQDISISNLPQLFGKFPEAKLEHSIKLFISRQNALHIKQPYLRIANGINYGYRVIENSSYKDKVLAESVMLGLILLTYRLDSSENCKQDKFHLRLSLYYVLMQLYISMGSEERFLKISGELVKTVLFLRERYNFKDSYYNVVKSFILISLYTKKAKQGLSAVIFSFCLRLGKNAFAGFNDSRVEKTFEELSESISDLSLLKKIANDSYQESGTFY